MVREQRPTRPEFEGLMRCPDRGGHVPWFRVLTDDRDRRGCQARPREAGSRPSSPGRTSGRFCASWVFPGMRFQSEAHCRERSARKRLNVLGRQPSLEHRSAGPGIKGTAVRGAAGPRGDGLPACFRPASRPGSTAPRAPSFLEEAQSLTAYPRAARLRGYGRVLGRMSRLRQRAPESSAMRAS